MAGGPLGPYKAAWAFASSRCPNQRRHADQADAVGGRVDFGQQGVILDAGRFPSETLGGMMSVPAAAVTTNWFRSHV